MVPTSGGFGSETKPYVYAKCPPKGNRDHPADVDHACPAPLKDREWPRINAEPAACPLPPLRTSRLSAPPASGAAPTSRPPPTPRSEEHTSELQSRLHLVCRLLLEKKK